MKGTTSTVFIKGIDINAFEKDIEEFMTKIEKPLQVRHKWFEDRPGIAFIQFSSPEVATKVVIDMNNEYIKDRYINTDWSEERKKSVNTRGPRNARNKILIIFILPDVSSFTFFYLMGVNIIFFLWIQSSLYIQKI